MNIRNPEEMLKWIKYLGLEEDKFYNNKTGRFCCWLGLGVRLGTNEIYEAGEIPERLKVLGERLYGDFNSILIYKYQPGIGINKHKDQPCFDKKVVLVNLGSRCIFRLGSREINLEIGEIFNFNSQILHSVDPVDSERYSVQFRKVK